MSGSGQEVMSIPEVAGGLLLEASARGLRAIRFEAAGPGADRPGPVTLEAARQIQEYFEGERCRFDVQLDLRGTAFQLAVWSALLRIPYAGTRSYRDIAAAMERPRGCQAVGQANTRNPVPIVVPCYRVIQADGSPGGYGGGADRKMLLLELEKRYAERF